ncbi:MAG: DUF2309 domain-containing protein [Pseudomonadota bacterium]
MTSPVHEMAPELTTDVQSLAIEAGQRIAPTWPLDQFIAVNPWWEMRGQSYAEVAAKISLLGHAQGHMPRDWFKAQFENTIQPQHLAAAAAEAESITEQALIDWLDEKDRLPHWRNFSDQIDSTRNLERHVSWHDEIVQQISQFCASYYSSGTPLPSDPNQCLYEAWLDNVRHDRGIEILMGERGLHRCFEALPATADALIDEAASELSIEQSLLSDYFHALLLDINGWASWVSYQRWQSALVGGSDDAMPQILAVRLAWELVLWRHFNNRDPEGMKLQVQSWHQQLSRLPEMLRQFKTLQRPAMVWQRAAEIAFQSRLHEELRNMPETAQNAATRPELQAVFCIDVRSEVYRRALEAQDDNIQTLGFAGFFGLPIDYQQSGTAYKRPQMPGLLNPVLTVHEAIADGAARAARNNRRARWSALSKKAPASFGYVESVGIGYAITLLRESVLGGAPKHPVNSCCNTSDKLVVESSDGALDIAAQAELVAGVLGAMTLTSNFASVVMIVGHGSSTRNNPHAAGLDCGACCGQTGEINVRVLAQILNDAAIRQALAQSHDIDIPNDTLFVAGLHDTTTDEMRCLNVLPENASHVQAWLDGAGASSRRERARRLGLDTADCDSAIRARSRDWSQTRPEWGLANNACFIVAPRSRCKHIDLGGRSFLHDYKWQEDEKAGYPVLELIMTAPMVVTNWINTQYNLSVIDNETYGCGNKVLHNVVGGNIGVFEGNGGDLRIGLSMQSLSNGEQWMHDPLRLSVYIAAPREPIADIARRHELVQQLIDNDWLYLFRLDDDPSVIERYYRGEWIPADASLASAA